LTNLPVETASIFREQGFEAETVGDESLSGADDAAIANRVRVEIRILVTLDLDFSNIRAYPPEEYAGIIVLRLKTQDKPNWRSAWECGGSTWNYFRSLAQPLTPFVLR